MKKTADSLGISDCIKSKKILSKFSIGKKGIKFKTNSKNGKSAIKKLNEILLALLDIAPWIIPIK